MPRASSRGWHRSLRLDSGTGVPFRVLLLGLLLGGTSCFTLRAPEKELAPDQCSVPEELVGTWRSVRSSQIGKASAKLTLECDCTYRMRIRALGVLQIKESGPFMVDQQQLMFFRSSGEVTTWPYRLEQDGGLLLEEGGPEPMRYRRLRARRCSTPAAPASPQ